jgi:hypothetical protein
MAKKSEPKVEPSAEQQTSGPRPKPPTFEKVRRKSSGSYGGFGWPSGPAKGGMKGGKKGGKKR